jgi:hypothetical protein
MTMNYRLRLLLVTTAVFACGWLVWISKCEVVSRSGSLGGDSLSTAAGLQSTQAASSPESLKRFPKAVVEKATHAFGIIDPSQKCKYTFLIRNEGQAPLQLTRGATSCKCTMSDLPDDAILPGTGAPVRIASKIAQKSGDFSHSATIFTNDPQNPSITLCIQGTIRRYVAAYPTRIVLSGMRRKESKSVQAVVYSQVWDHFDLDDVVSTLDGLSWRVAPADSDTLAKLDARSGYRLEVTVPPDLPGGSFWERLQMSVIPDDEAASPRTFVLDVTGSVSSRISIHNPKIDSQKVLRLGVLRGGEGARERLIMNVRDEYRKLAIRHVDATPDFLRVDVAPYRSGANKLGLYAIDVEIPRDAPMSDFLASKGEIRIQTDHPTVPTLTLEVAFAVLGE